MSNWNPQANDIFLNAIDIESDDGRHDYVLQACGGDDTLRGEVESLLVAHHIERGLLDGPLVDPGQQQLLIRRSANCTKRWGPIPSPGSLPKAVWGWCMRRINASQCGVRWH